MARTKQIAGRSTKWSLFLESNNQSMWVTQIATGPMQNNRFTYTDLSWTWKKGRGLRTIENVTLDECDPPFIQYFNERYVLINNFYSEMLKIVFSPKGREIYKTSKPLTKDQVIVLEESLVFDTWFQYLDPFTSRNLALTCKKYYELIFVTKIIVSDDSMSTTEMKEMIRFKVPTLRLRVRLYECGDEILNQTTQSSSSEDEEEEELKTIKKTKYH